MNIKPNQNIYLHVRLKGIDINLNYQDLTLYLIDYFEQKFNPKSILVPVYNYDFLKGIPFNLKITKSQVGRFSEECRIMFQKENNRSLNPVFSSIDIKNLLKFNELEKTSFGESTLYHKLAKDGYYIINVNIDLSDMRNIHLHYLEEKFKVSYRYFKNFHADFSTDGKNFFGYDFQYFVRQLDTDTLWKRFKMGKDFIHENILTEVSETTFAYNYIHSKDLDNFIKPMLDKNDKYMIINE